MTLSLDSISDDLPSGDNLEYEQIFTDMVLAAQASDDKQVGDEVVDGEEADPKGIAAAAGAVLEQSHDLRAAVLMGYANLRIEGFPGFSEATAYIRGCLEQFWDTCHPQLDADDDNDATMRVNAVLGLADSEQTLRALRRAPLTDSRGFGGISVRDLMIAGGEIDLPEGEDAPPSDTQIAAAFRDTPADRLDVILAAARSAQEDLIAVDAVFDEKLPGEGPDLGPVLMVLKRAVSRLSEAVGEESVADDGDEADQSDMGSSAAPSEGNRVGDISSARDVERVLEQVIRYYERSEPSSPVPIILARAKRLIGADFMTIVNDIAPGGADNVRLIGGDSSADGESE